MADRLPPYGQSAGTTVRRYPPLVFQRLVLRGLPYDSRRRFVGTSLQNHMRL